MVVIPAEAGTHFLDWIPAFAGMTKSGSYFGLIPLIADSGWQCDGSRTESLMLHSPIDRQTFPRLKTPF